MARKPTTKKKKEKQPAAAPPLPAQVKDRFEGELASSVETRNVEWFVDRWIPFGMLTLVAGESEVGKSTLLASLIALATTGNGFGYSGRPRMNATMLPGFEEAFEVITKPRLFDVGVDLGRVLLLRNQHYGLLRDREGLAKRIKRHGSRLVVIDPIDSYFDEGLSEDQGQHVRPILESAERLANETGAAVLCVRHPGKQDTNILPGSRHWKNVPRVVLHLTKDGITNPTYTMSCYKYSFKDKPKPTRYRLADPATGQRFFTLLNEMDQTAEELHKSQSGPTGRYKLRHACHVIKWYFDNESNPTRTELGNECKKQGIGEDTLNDAMRMLGVISVPGKERNLPWIVTRESTEWPEWLCTTPPSEGSGDIRSSPPQR